MLTKQYENLILEEQTAEQPGITQQDALEICLVYAVVLAMVVFVFNYVLMLALIPSGSMENTLMTGDIAIATRFDRTDIQRYDIMVFTPPDYPDTYYIKRVVGLPGETITIDNGNVYAGDELLDNSILPEKMIWAGDGVYKVPKGCYFMLGDNRNHSQDARFWEDKYVPLENMAAKAWFTIFPFTRLGSLRYQGPGNTAAASEPASSTGRDVGEGIHVWTMAQESGSSNLVLCCRDCGRQQYLELLQINEEPDGGCAQHLVVLAEVGHAELNENGTEWVVDRVSLYCKDCGWNASAVPDRQG